MNLTNTHFRPYILQSSNNRNDLNVGNLFSGLKFSSKQGIKLNCLALNLFEFNEYIVLA